MSEMQETDQSIDAVNQAGLSKRLALLPAAWVYRAWVRTLRLRFDADIADALRRDSRGALFVLWHNRAFLSAHLHNILRPRGKKIFGLVSASRDGAWLSAVFARFGISVIRGSSSRRGSHALRESLRVLRAGHDIGITLDGPRGPAYIAKEGIGLLARHSGAPVVHVVPCYPSAWRLRSWDRFFIPKPFSRVDLRIHRETPDESGHASPRSDARGRAIGETLRRLTAGSDPELGI